MRTCAAKVPLPSECRISHSSQSTYFDAVALLENVLGRGDSWTMSGGQWGAWNAAYGPRGDDGRPVPLWDPRTGVINRAAAAHWKAYDLRRVLEQNWAVLGPKLQGKIHIWV